MVSGLNRLLTTKEQWVLGCCAIAIIIGALVSLLGKPQPSLDSPHRTGEEKTPSHFYLPAAQPSPNTVPSDSKNLSFPNNNTPQLEGEHGTIVPSGPTDSAQLVGVAVMGAIRNPGFYTFHPGARVADLIAAAGGTLDKADLSALALTAELIDETTLTIPEKSVRSVEDNPNHFLQSGPKTVVNPPQYVKAIFQQPKQVSINEPSVYLNELRREVRSATPVNPSPSTDKINLNTATQEQLEQLPGIGPTLARAIITAREQQTFTSVEDLKRVNGIGNKKLEAIRPFVVAP